MTTTTPLDGGEEEAALVVVVWVAVERLDDDEEEETDALEVDAWVVFPDPESPLLAPGNVSADKGIMQI